MKFRTISGALSGRQPSLARLRSAKGSASASKSAAAGGGTGGGADSRAQGPSLSDGLRMLADLVKEAAQSADGHVERSGRIDLSGQTGREGLTLDYGINVQFGIDQALKRKGGDGGGGGGRPADPPSLPPGGPGGGDSLMPFDVSETDDKVLLMAPVEELDLATLDLRLSDDNKHLEVLDRDQGQILEAVELPCEVDGTSGEYLVSGQNFCLGMEKLKS